MTMWKISLDLVFERALGETHRDPAGRFVNKVTTRRACQRRSKTDPLPAVEN
jgi:hypothetical protein